MDEFGQRVSKAVEKMSKKTIDVKIAFTLGVLYAKMREKPKAGQPKEFYYTNSYKGDLEIWECMDRLLENIEND